MLRRTFLTQSLMLLASSLLRAPSVFGRTDSGASPETIRHLAAAVGDLLRALQPESQKAIRFSFDDAERKKWTNVPNAVQPRRGLAFGKMSDSERMAAHRLLQMIMSTQGYLKATGIMSLENVLREIHAADVRDFFSPEFYFLSVFGSPEKDDRWALRIDGHHLALHLTVIDNQITSTPLFMGTEPATVQHGHLAGLSVLGAETMKGFALRNALTVEQAKLAVLSQDLPPDIFTGPGRDNALSKPAGVPASRFQGRQRELMESLVDEYLGNMHPQVARSYRHKVQQDGFDAVHFAWMGP